DRWYPVSAPQPCSVPMAVPTIVSENNMDIYPNPANNQITITSDKHNITGVEIYNMLGERVYASLNLPHILATTIAIAPLNNGVYLLKIATGDNATSRKLVIQK
ncbi:MAG TPA: T9SS type A sorting domain-containing protein, partial [Bacteroidia bacterium]|nr:T9SS type A sorting domain-containing protein [Bacteroidia bacterium]